VIKYVFLDKENAIIPLNFGSHPPLYHVAIPKTGKKTSSSPHYLLFAMQTAFAAADSSGLQLSVIL